MTGKPVWIDCRRVPSNLKGQPSSDPVTGSSPVRVFAAESTGGREASFILGDELTNHPGKVEPKCLDN